MIKQATSQANPEQSQLLEQLRDVHNPDAISWWPLAPGWWIIIALVILIGTLLIIRVYLKKRHHRFARSAVNELKQLQLESEPRWLAKSQNIMRRASLCYISSPEVSRMNQAQWIAFLQSTGQGSLSKETLQKLKDLPFQPAQATEHLDKEAMLNEFTQWCLKLPQQSKQWRPNNDNDEVTHV